MSGEENLANAIRDYLVDEFLVPFSEEDKERFGLGSPIEGLLMQGIVIAGQILVGFPKLGFKNAEKGKLGWESQAKILEYRVDFLFSAQTPGGKIRRLVVECDGHNFHERTKEQAEKDRSRDRRLQEAGYTVYQFTGSEIYRDAFSCARQVFRWSQNVCDGAE